MLKCTSITFINGNYQFLKFINNKKSYSNGFFIIYNNLDNWVISYFTNSLIGDVLFLNINNTSNIPENSWFDINTSNIKSISVKYNLQIDSDNQHNINNTNLFIDSQLMII